MKNTDRLSARILGNIRESLGLDDPEDTSKDNEINLLTNRELFEHFIQYEGIIGYTQIILNTIEKIYGVDLKNE